jgi:ADP-L-glycero-D-manno-heptose 6-epimerase
MILVTGGAGFIGSNIVAALADAGAEVAVCDWLRTDERWRNLAKHLIADLVAPERLFDWLTDHGRTLDTVVHMGAISSTTETDGDLFAENNIRLTLRLWDWCARHDVRLIYASSAATYGDGSAGFDDDASAAGLARLQPLNAYGWSKHAVDRRIGQLVERGAKAPPQWAGLKFFNVYGPNEYHKGTMKSVVAQNHATVAAGQPIRLFRSYRQDYGDGGQVRDFVYVRDCVDVIVWLLANPGVNGLFNLGTGQARSWLDLARALFAATGQAERVEFIDMPETLRAKYQYFTEARMAKLRAAGYDRPFTTLEDGIADYVARFLARGDSYR